MSGDAKFITLYPLENYTFGVKDAQVILEKFAMSDSFRWKRTLPLKVDSYEWKKTMKRRECGGLVVLDNPELEVLMCTEGILLVHQHRHPHVLLLQIGTSFFKLPGGKLKPGEDEVEGLKRKMTKKLAPAAEHLHPLWQVGEVVSQWWRPTFETFLYPYVPAHVTKPKECKKVSHVPLPDKCMFAVPRNLKLLAVPFFELYDNAQRYGPVIAAIPQLFSRYNFVYV